MKRLNNLYYSKRIKELLAELQTAGTTLVVAPMGYGKTLAVQYFLQEQERCGKTQKYSLFWDLHRAVLLTQCETLVAHNCEGTEQLHKIIINSILLLTY